MNLFTQFDELLNPDVIAKVALYVGEPTDKTTKAIQGLVYTVFGGFLKRTTTEIGVNQLYNHLKKGQYDGNLTGNLTATLRDPAQTHTIITHGNDVISHLLPAMKSSIGTMISGYAGIRNSSAISLLGLVTTMVLDVLGRRVRDQKLDADTLATSLFNERDAFMTIVPDELMHQLVDKMGIRNIMAGVAAPARSTVPVTPPGRSGGGYVPPTTVYEPEEERTDNGSLAKWAIGVLLAAAVGVGGYFVWQNTQRYADDTETVDETIPLTDTAQADTVARSLAVPIDSVGMNKPAATAGAVSGPVSTSTASITAIASKGTLTQQVSTYLADPVARKGRIFPLTGITFQPGSLTLVPGSEAIIGEVANLLNQHPTMQIQLVGYANDAAGGITNKSLSFKRVNQIKQELVKAGINFVRVDAIGRGTGVTIKRPDSTGTVVVPKLPTLRKIDLKVVLK